MTYYSPSYIFQLVLLRVNYHVSTWLTPDRRAQETPYELIKHMLAFFLIARRTPLDFGMIIAHNPSSRSAPRTMIGVEGRESLPNSPTMGSRPELVHFICIHRGPGIENTIWRAQVYLKAIRTRSHEFTLIRFGFTSFTGFIISSMIRRFSEQVAWSLYNIILRRSSSSEFI